MTKKLLSFLLLLLGISRLAAAPVDLSVARKAGESFVQANFAVTSRGADLRLVMTTSAFYVFNVSSSGFVIVSSDDAFRPIIGYSDEGVFDMENPSPEMMYYLDNISKGRQAALRAAINPDGQVAREWSALLEEGQPLIRGNNASFYLVTTRWNQDYPYNKFCPRDGNGARSYAGCVATAMSQVMNYWKYPTHGYGQHSYNHYQFGLLSADFSAAEYDFSLMPASIGEMSPEENIDAIALFMYHCGIAVDMSYGTDGSGAYSQDVPDAVLKYFGYTNCCRLHYRDSYSLAEFQALLRDQFDMGWPCYYSGQDTNGSGGHAFVCDGYDSNDMFHFNWGWSGSGDGFFVIDGLDVSSYAFNSDQGVITNFVPADVFAHTAKAPDAFMAVPNGDEEFSVTLSWVNPTATLDGHPLESIDAMEILRDGEVVHTIENPAVGEAMTYVDPVGKPITVDYSVRFVCQGAGGRKAWVRGVNLGPACDWTIRLTSENDGGWGDGAVTFLNSAGVTIAELTADRGESEYQVEIPQGRLSILWTAPTDSLYLGIEIMDANGLPLFSYQGPSTDMPSGIFYEMVNICDGQGSIGKPTALQAEVVGDDVALQWTGIADPGYGYNIYRDGRFYTIVDETSFTDVAMATEFHSYFVTAFCKEGETDPSNTVCAIVDDERAPRNLDYEMLPNGKMKLKWESPENTEGHAGYKIFRKAEGEQYKRIKQVGANSNDFTEGTRVPDGKRYYYMVVAAYPDLDIESSPARSLQHPDLCYVMVNRTHIPSDLVLEQLNETSLLLQWEPAVLAETYNVYCNGELVAEGLVEPQFEDVVRGEALMYQVTGMLNGVESSPSNKAYYGNYAIGENNMADATLYPNPTKGSVTVNMEGLREVKVFNVIGQLVMSRKANGNEMNLELSGLDSGVYYFNIRTDHGNRVQKVVLM